MLSWVRRRRDKTERIETDADAFIHDLGVGAHSAARRREHEATSEAMARHWRRVALAVARKTGRRVGLDTATRMASNADFSSEGNLGAPSPRPVSDVDPLGELMRLVRSVRAPKRLRYWRQHAERKRTASED